MGWARSSRTSRSEYPGDGADHRGALVPQPLRRRSEVGSSHAEVASHRLALGVCDRASSSITLQPTAHARTISHLDISHPSSNTTDATFPLDHTTVSPALPSLCSRSMQLWSDLPRHRGGDGIGMVYRRALPERRPAGVFVIGLIAAGVVRLPPRFVSGVVAHVERLTDPVLRSLGGHLPASLTSARPSQPLPVSARGRSAPAMDARSRGVDHCTWGHHSGGSGRHARALIPVGCRRLEQDHNRAARRSPRRPSRTSSYAVRPGGEPRTAPR